MPETKSNPKAEPRLAPENRAQPQADRPEVSAPHQGAGIDLPVVGHVGYKSVGLWAGLGVVGAAGVIDWPVAAAIGVAYALSRS